MVGADRGYRTCHIVFLDSTVTDDNYVIQEESVFADGNLRRHLGCCECLSGVAYAADFNDSVSTGYSEDKVSVKTGGYAIGGSFFKDCRTDDRTSLVNDYSFDLISALGEYRRR